MLKVAVLATGSTGNCYTLTNEEAVIMLDCGLPFKKLHKLSKFQLPTAILVTHEHKDHAKAVTDYLKRGVDVYMTRGTANKLEIEKNHRLHYINPKKPVNLQGIKIKAFDIKHDALEPCGFIIEDKDDRVLYLTDAGEVPQLKGQFTKILIEANYKLESLRESLKTRDISVKLYERIKETHLSIEQVLDFLSQTDLTELKEIWLIHLSSRHSIRGQFKQLVEAMTGKTVYLATNG